MIDFGISSNEFRSQYHEKKPFLVRSAIKTMPDTTAEICQALCASEHSDGRVNVFLKGLLIPYGMFTETYQDVSECRSIVSIQRIEEYLEQGATVAINRIDRNTEYAKQLCDQIKMFSREVSTANCYVATSGEGSFGAHWDTHDVIAAQIDGSKRWQLWSPTHPLPAPNQRSKARRGEITNAPELDIELHKGDALYVPRGWWHFASPIDGKRTVHYAVGLHTPMVTDYISWLTETVLLEHAELRSAFARMAQKDGHLGECLELTRSIAMRAENIEAFKDRHEALLKKRERTFQKPL
ncbi:Uncharacterized conserved protein [Luteibacter sp. 22Crub2.1]|nr:Uncharacterized conserved protein [Luteibacter sp. 22Crub2.1]